MLRLKLTLLLLLGMAAPLAGADVFRPAYLEIEQKTEQRYGVLWKVPALDEQTRLAAYVAFPAETQVVEPSRVFQAEGAWVERWVVEHPEGLTGKRVLIEGTAAGITDIIVRVVRLDGSTQVERLPMGKPSFTITAPAGGGEIAVSYLVLGFEHILGGVDHLLFVLALLLIVRSARRLVATVTAFTAAHSITLGAASMGWVNVPSPPVEALIALSIVFVAVEVVHLRAGRAGLTARAPWIVAFSFGLLHGLGFAGALSEVGLPQTDIFTALLMFNVGVELGQLAFIAAALTVGAVLRYVWSQAKRWGPPVVSYGIGGIAAFWTVERVAAFWLY